MDPSEGQWPVASRAQRSHRLPFAIRRGPGFPIHSGGLATLILGHSPDGKTLTARRAGQQLLQAFDAAPVAFLHCLRYSSLQPPDRLVDLGLVNTVPVLPYVGGNIAGIRVHINLRG
jgi:hypothetical protein